MIEFYKNRVEHMEAMYKALKNEIELLQAEIDALADLASKQEDNFNDKLEAMEKEKNFDRQLYDVFIKQMCGFTEKHRQYQELSLRLDDIL